MEHADAIAKIKQSSTKIKKILDNPSSASRHATVAVVNANTQLNRLALELSVLERTLTQFVTAPGGVKMGPSETKSK